MKVAFISGISWKGLSDIKGSTDHTLRTAVLNEEGCLSTDPCLCLLFILENPFSWAGLPAFPNLSEGPAPGPLSERTHPLESDARECPQYGKGGEGTGVSLWN